MKLLSFRYDINGLRGLAVLAVIIFHYNASLLTGGFTGVDVFFVISGYLMTAIILNRLNLENFSLLQFYKARAERIIPALLTVCTILLLLGYILFEPITYQLLGQHSFSALTFISNITAWQDASYFDVGSQYKFLLHSWSLSVEWQFYLLYPLFILFLYRFIKVNSLKYIIIFCAFISFITNLYLIPRYPTFAFFLLPTRMWELLMGSLAFLHPITLSQKKKTLYELFSLILILISFIIIPKLQPWRSYLVALPVLGAYLCILSNNPKTILMNKIIQKIGTYSYAIYLTHWPILVFFKTIYTTLPFYIYCILTFATAFILHQLVEKKRNYGIFSIIIYALILSLSYHVSIDGISKRVNLSNQLDQPHFHASYYGGLNIPERSIITHFNTRNNNGKPSFILTGDSHARQYGNYLRDAHYNFITVLKDGCLSLPDIYLDIFQKKQEAKECHILYKKLHKALNENPQTPLIIIQRWDIYQNFYNEFVHNKIFSTSHQNFAELLSKEITKLIKNNGDQRKYFIVGDTFTANNSIPKCKVRSQLYFYQHIFPLHCSEHLPPQKINTDTILLRVIKKNPNIYFINPNGNLCNTKECRLTDQNHNPIFSDDNHLSFSGANFVGPYVWNKILTLEKTQSPK